MEKPTPFQGPAGRRNLLAALGSLTLFTFLASRLPGNATTNGNAPAIDATRAAKTVKMLTQDGRLVEVDISLINPVKKVTNEELRDWIKSNKL